jgi:uncharacterized membrane protein
MARNQGIYNYYISFLTIIESPVVHTDSHVYNFTIYVGSVIS